MRRFSFVIVLVLSCQSLYAQTRDSLFVSYEKERLVIHHKVSLGETVFMLARRYHVPAAVLADANGLTYSDGLEKGQKVYIPVGPYNQQTTKPVNGSARPVYYKVSATDNLYRISKMASLTQHDVQEFNDLPDNTIRPGQVLMLGWVAYDVKDIPSGNPPVVEKKEDKYETVIVMPQQQDTTRQRVLTNEEKLYLQQTNNEQAVFDEKGTAVFYEMPGKVGSKRTFFAFHNTVAKGTIIKVYNPGTEKTTFVKVLGPIPGTKQYHGSVIAISEGAKQALGVTDNRTWCELKYAAY